MKVNRFVYICIVDDGLLLLNEIIKQVQQKLHQQGFDAGPVNGDFGAKTQAALAQFQLSRVLPASGALDDQTLAELGVSRNPTTQEDANAPGTNATN